MLHQGYSDMLEPLCHKLMQVTYGNKKLRLHLRENMLYLHYKDYYLQYV
jgi:hypothetical protein